jgi:hypothetical protein
VRWDKTCRSKKRGGLGIKDLRKFNISLLVKWWWLLESEEGLWQDIVRLKYVKQSPICMIPHRIDDSPLWKDLMKIRHLYLKGRTFKLNNGRGVSFWLDCWLDDTRLCLCYPVLFYLSTDQKISIHEVARNGWVIQFKVRLYGILREQWYQLAANLNRVNLNNEKDIPIWNWTASKKFSVKSTYEQLTRGDGGSSYRRVWKAKLPKKIKIFMWLLEQKAILTKDNMLKRKWKGDPGCIFVGLLKVVII